ncbi:esterase-like activity of phytase family protein [Roseivivax sediminis]|uniref:Phytase-like domain-containing protein n=1 Tax=Roseivivax sediminis TaxID=936889 RepID=A0A1I1U203_9RHOB|nr:esterase-like activity of phytase family protein [Roseivivax sediminis]SFD64857.1 hypothetical protein SAMN04515678_102109 [Roseivivax sediminis]
MLRRPDRALGAVLLASVALTSSAGPPEGARLVGETPWTVEATAFGGLSGLELSADGRRFTAIGDRGLILSGTIARDDSGRIEDIETGPLRRLREADGQPVTGARLDSEGLAIGPAGTFVSFEGIPRILRLDEKDRGTPIELSAEMKALEGNSGLEALAIDLEGRLVALPERSGRLTRPFPVWRLEGGSWRVVARIPRSGGFLVTGADIGPDGRLYVLERSFTVIGFRSRVRRFELTDEGARAETLLLETGTGVHDNLEGISAWQDADGAIRLTMVSDDNFNPLQRTEFVEYLVRD